MLRPKLHLEWAYLGLVLSLITLVIPQSLRADFLKTGPFIYQNSDDKRTKVIVVPTTEKTPGIFVLYGKEQKLQLFDPNKLDFKETKSVFFGYDKQKRRFTKLYVGPKSFSIQGSITLRLGDKDFPRIALDQSSKNSYISIIHNKGEKQYSLVGFLGVLEVINISGKNALLFEANAIHERSKDAISEYSVDGKHQLTLDGKALPVKHVGIALEMNIPCQEQDSVIIPPTEKKFDTKNKALLQEQALLHRGKGLSLENLLPLRVQKDAFWGFDYITSDIIKIAFVGKTLIERAPSKVCVSEYITESNPPLPSKSK